MRFEDAARGGAPPNDDERNAFVLGFKKSVSDVMGDLALVRRVPEIPWGESGANDLRT
jgi:hypothetical protein